MNNKQYDRKAGKARSAIESHLAVMYQVATWRDRKERELEVLQAENKRLRIQLRLAGEWLVRTEDHSEALVDRVFGRVATVMPDDKDKIRHLRIEQRIKELRERDIR